MDEARPGSLERIDVTYVARLARLQLTPEETELFQAQLDQIVGYMRKIRELDLAGIEPTSHAHPVHNVFRDDRVSPSLDRESVLANAPDTVAEQFRVPKIVE